MKKNYNYRKPIIKSYELKDKEMEIKTETETEIKTETTPEKRFLCFKSIREIINHILKTIFN